MNKKLRTYKTAGLVLATTAALLIIFSIVTSAISGITGAVLFTAVVAFVCAMLGAFFSFLFKINSRRR